MFFRGVHVGSGYYKGACEGRTAGKHLAMATFIPLSAHVGKLNVWPFSHASDLGKKCCVIFELFT